MTVAAPEAHDLWERLAATARRRPDRAVSLFSSTAAGDSWQRRTLPEIVAAAELGASRLSAHGVGAGDVVLVVLPTGWRWLTSWLGAVRLGALPAAAAPPGYRGPRRGELHRLERLAESLDARLVVAGGPLAAAGRDGETPELARRLVTGDELEDTAGAPLGARRGPAPAEAAFLQLTSGTTRVPRAVEISHRAVLHNVAAIDEATGAPHGAPAHRWISGWTSWLPLHHDMGLVGCLLNALVSGFDLRLLPPGSFLAGPGRWLAAMAGGGTWFTTAPDFGYRFTLDRVEPPDVPDLDLSGWRAAMIGAEMIHPATVRRFAERWQPRGFDPGIVRPCYGLAEATLAVTLDRRGEGLRTGAPAADAGREVACLGPPVADTEVRIAAPDGRALPDGTEGEVRVRGPGLASGYRGDPEETRRVFAGGWLRTGDLGFLRGGELYLTGRLKDLIIVRGQNLSPHEIEWLAEEEMGEGAGFRAAAFSVDRGQGETVVVVVETAASAEAREACARRIRLRVADELTLPLADVRCVRRGTIGRTTSGKIRRAELRERYLAGELAGHPERVDAVAVEEGRERRGP